MIKFDYYKPNLKKAKKISVIGKRIPWTQDKKGYFLIKLDRRRKVIIVGFCKTIGVVSCIIEGKMPQEIYEWVAKNRLIERPEHYAYLGKELHKAYVALKLKKRYVQDSELDFNT